MAEINTEKLSYSDLYEVDIHKLEVGDIIYWDGLRHTIESINKGSQGMIKSITTNSHHLCGYNIFSKDKSKKIN